MAFSIREKWRFVPGDAKSRIKRPGPRRGLEIPSPWLGWEAGIPPSMLSFHGGIERSFFFDRIPGNDKEDG
jgi:hypothetical protein